MRIVGGRKEEEIKWSCTKTPHCHINPVVVSQKVKKGVESPVETESLDSFVTETPEDTITNINKL